MPARHPLVGKEKPDPPFFILGSGRNGSTLLGSMLAANSQAAVVPEQFALGYVAIKYRLKPQASWKKQVAMACDMFSNPELSHWEHDFSATRKELLALPKQRRNLRNMVDRIYKDLLRVRGQHFKIYGDKSPKNIHLLEYIFPLFRDAKYLYLIRDGRDVVRSYVEGGPQNFGEYGHWQNAVIRWNDANKKWAWLEDRVAADQRHVVRYEDLVDKPKETLVGICDFLGIRFEEEMLEHTRNDHLNVADDPVHQNLKKAINTSSIGAWRAYFSDEQVDLLQERMKDGLTHWGYE